MRLNCFSFLLGLTAASSAFAQVAPAASVEARVHDLLSRMTLEEKVGQLVQYSSRKDMTGPASQASVTPQLEQGQVGSMLNIIGVVETRKWQQIAVERSRLHIPLLFGLDVIHGYRTIFPIPLASAASWDMARIENAERIAAKEAAAAGIHWTFAPMVDISRDPRWGRIAESAGEDPFLGSAVARARVRGFQGDGSFSDAEHVLACAKHFAAYGAAQAGRDYFTTDVTERVLREVYLPPFKAAKDAGVATFMAAFNDLDGTPCSSNPFLLDRVLRGEWGFKGFVVSDWGSIEELRAHGNVTDIRDAALKAFNAGLDMDMENGAFGPHLAEFVREGKVSMARLDQAVGAILAAKFRLGLFDDPYRFCNEQRQEAALLNPEHLAAARDLARRSCVLLKNQGDILPLKTDGALKVALVGPLANAHHDQLGTWLGKGDDHDTVTVRDALEKIYGKNLHFAPGCATRGDDTSGLAEARRSAEASDVVVVAVGEDVSQSGESTSRTSLDFSGPQLALIREVRAAGKPIVLLVMSGRPLVLESVEPLVDAILVGWHPGTMGGPAIADVLTGAYNPSGKLPVSWPRSVGQIPVFYAHKNSGRPEPLEPKDPYFSHYIDAPNTPQYPFGFGLSYTTFVYDQLRVSAPTLGEGGAITVTARVRNAGKRAGEEVVQLYVRDRVGSVTRPVRELKGFQKIELAAGEAREVSFQITPADLAFWRADMTFGPEPGEFTVFVGPDSTSTLSAAFKLESSTGSSP
jgi:beta-glucosidase